jgi:hypothetical protein
MMQRFYRWMRHYSIKKLSANEIACQTVESLRERGSSINFSIHFAENGYVLETNSYDRKEDEHTRKLYLIQNNDEIGSRIEHIITVESLSR